MISDETASDGIEKRASFFLETSSRMSYKFNTLGLYPTVVDDIILNLDPKEVEKWFNAHDYIALYVLFAVIQVYFFGGL